MKRIAWVAGLALGCGVAAADLSGVALQDTELKVEPDPSSETVRPVAGGTQVALGERRGGWYRASVDDDAGWMRLLSVRLAGDARRPGVAGVGALLQVGRSEATVSTGVRGLTASDLRNAREDRDALAALIAMQPDQDEVEAFAAAGPLAARAVDAPEAGKAADRGRR